MAQKKTEIRLYPTFTEVREDVKATAPFHVYLPQDVYNQILPGSLSLEGVKVLSMNAVLKENNLEGKKLFVNKDKEVREVKVIRGRDLMVQDTKTGRYFNVSRSEVEYNEVPEETGTEVTFVLENGGNSILSYLMYGIKWKPRYNFNIESDKHEFQGWADIENTTQREYVVDKTELFGGDVSLSRQPQHRAYGEVMMCRTMAYDSAPAPSVQSEGEKSGLYMYSIGDKYTLAPSSTFSLPFVQPIINLERVATYSTYFSERKAKGKFSRVYRIKSSEFLPSGTVTVREDGRVVGQATVPDLSVNESHDLNVGNDPDVSYEREVKTIFSNNDGAKYEVSITVTNNKQRDIKFTYEETVSQRNEITQTKPQLTVENSTIKNEQNLPSKGNTSFSYVIQLFYNIN